MAARQQHPTVSIIIVSYNVRDLLLQCLGSLGDRHGEVIVVDNASSDGSAGAVREATPHVTLISNDANAGFARANNQALALASGDYLLLLNPDTRVCDNAVDVLERFMTDHPEYGIAGPRLLNLDGSLQSAGRRFPTSWTVVRDPLTPRADPGGLLGRRSGTLQAAHVEDCDWVLGACLMVRREVLRQVGHLDEGYFMYGEEKDLCYRAKAAGWRVACVHEAEVIHYGGQSADQVPARSYEAFMDSQFRFLGKFYPGHYRWLFGIASYVGCRSLQCVCGFRALSASGRREYWSTRAGVFAAGARRCLDHLARRR